MNDAAKLVAIRDILTPRPPIPQKYLFCSGAGTELSIGASTSKPKGAWVELCGSGIHLSARDLVYLAGWIKAFQEHHA